MRTFTCDNCGQLVFFDNSRCLRCDSPLGYLHQRRQIASLIEVAPDRLVELREPPQRWQRCATETITGCNWLVPDGTGALCESCVLTRTRPADADAEGLEEFVKAERAKRRLVFQLAELGLPIEPRDELAGRGVAFDLLSSAHVRVLTGHDDGVITLDLSEADRQHREHLREALDEPYRTLLGHFRHEIGHYYWSVLVNEPDVLDACRALFGDERADYAEALRRHYDAAPSNGLWAERHISRYATMHPAEDWAETFAHYLHIHDTLQTAQSFGLLEPDATAAASPDPSPGVPDSARPDRTFGALVDRWLTLTYATNQINRSMGHEDLYPFVLAAPVIRKLAFIDRLVRRPRG